MNCSFLRQASLATARDAPALQHKHYARASTLDEILEYHARELSAATTRSTVSTDAGSSPTRWTIPKITGLFATPRLVLQALRDRASSRDENPPPLAGTTYVVSPTRLAFILLAAVLGARRRLLGRLRRRKRHEGVVFPVRRRTHCDESPVDTAHNPQGFLV